MDLRYIHKQKAQLALSFLPIGDTPVQRFYIEISVDCSIYRNWFSEKKPIVQKYKGNLKMKQKIKK